MKALIVTLTTMSVLIINVCCFHYEYSENVEIIKHDLSLINIPKQFDARNKWSNCSSIGRVDMRSDYGQEWAVTSTSVMSDRMCIKTEGEFTESLSAKELIQCAVITRDGKQELIGCKGWDVRWEPFEFWKAKGIVTEKCKSQLEQNVCGSNRCHVCHYTCQDNTLDYRGEKTFAVKTLKSNTNNPDPRQIQAEIMINGPVMTLVPAGSWMAPPNRVISYDKSLDVVSGGKCYYKVIGWDLFLNQLTWLAVGSHRLNELLHLEFGKGFEKHIYAGVPDICKMNHPDLPP